MKYIKETKILMVGVFFILGLGGTYLTYDFADTVKFGKFLTGRGKGGGSGVDSATDGVAVGLGIISGFCFLSSTLLLISFKDDE
jgi:hypothetical protein